MGPKSSKGNDLCPVTQGTWASTHNEGRESYTLVSIGHKSHVDIMFERVESHDMFTDYMYVYMYI